MDQITNSIKKRIDNMDNNKKRMLDSILERARNSIDIDRLIVKRDDRLELILERKEVLRETNKHFKGITDSKIIEDKELENFWEEEYKPKLEINENIYENLMEEIDEVEWSTVIKNLKKGSAGGLSNITYEIIKECSISMKEILRRFFNKCIKTELMPRDWSKGVIYPIPKPGDWNFNLDKTRPITLLECPRKILMKILTNRLSKIF